MVYKLDFTKSSDKFIENSFHKSMKELGVFFGLKWTENTPKIVLVKNRQTIDLLHIQKTEPWLVAWADNNMRIVFILNKKEFKKHSSHKYSDEYYFSLIKHELSHLFYKILSRGRQGPAWLSEGVAIYTSGQNNLKRRPDEFKNFLTFYSKGGNGVYMESGFVVEMLVKKFGKNKLFELIKSLQDVSDEKQFSAIFKKNYGFQLSYKSINKYLR